MAYGQSSYGVKNPYGQGQSITTTIFDQLGRPSRYVRHFLSSTPLDVSFDANSPLSNIIDAIEASDFDIGGPSI